jgi:hypothetical protein
MWLHTGKEKAMRRSSFQGFGVGFSVLALLVLGGARPGGAVTVNDGCGDAGNGSQDIASLTATFDATTETIHVDLVLCAAPDDATKYRVRVDHTAPFFDDDDRNGDGVVDANDVCATTWDSGMQRQGTKHTGPGTSTVDGATLHYAVSLAALNPEGDTVFIWADTQATGIVDRAPDTDASAGSAAPEDAGEVLALRPVTTCNVPGGSCLVFVTSTLHNGNLGGLAGADRICQARADAAGLPGTFKAWLSDSTQAARARLTHAAVPYVLVEGTQVAAHWADLVDGTRAAPIQRNEKGDPETCCGVWTGTSAAGTAISPQCLDWTYESHCTLRECHGTIGDMNDTTSFWSRKHFDAVVTCFIHQHLYCFEQ